VKTERTVVFVRSRGMSGVWECYDETCYKGVSGITVMLSATTVSLAGLNKISRAKLAKFSSIRYHLRCEHDIKIKKVCQL